MVQAVDNGKVAPRRRTNGDRGLYKRVTALPVNGAEPDPTGPPGLRYVARQTAQGMRVYGQYRYRHPQTGKWLTEGLGRIPTPSEVQAMIERDEQVRERFPAMRVQAPEHYAFDKIRKQARKIVGLVDAFGFVPSGITLMTKQRASLVLLSLSTIRRSLARLPKKPAPSMRTSLRGITTRPTTPSSGHSKRRT